MDLAVLPDLQRQAVEAERLELPAQVLELPVDDPFQVQLERGATAISSSSCQDRRRRRIRLARPSAFAAAARRCTRSAGGTARPGSGPRDRALSPAARCVRAPVGRPRPAPGLRTNRHGQRQPSADRLVGAEDVVALDLERLARDSRSDGGLPSRSPPTQDPQRTNAGHRTTRRSHATVASARPTLRYSRGATTNSDSSKSAITLRTSSSGPGCGRADRRHVPQDRDLLAQPAADLGVLAGRDSGIVETVEQSIDAPQRDDHRPPPGLGRVRGQDRHDRHPTRPELRSPHQIRHPARISATASTTDSSMPSPDAHAARAGEAFVTRCFSSARFVSWK